MKRGFTLIELLAVIVILAIIALIATPIVLNIIDETKDNATLRSAEFYLDAVENQIMLENMTSGGSFNPNTCTITNGNLTCNGKTVVVEVKGEKPISGTLKYENGKVTSVNLIYTNGLIFLNNKQELELITKEIPEPKSFAEDSWETIALNVKIGNISAYKVGDTKEIALTGFTNEEKDANGNNIGTYTIRIANTSTPEECKVEGFSQTACGFVIEFEDIIAEHNMNQSGEYKGVQYDNGWNKDGYQASSMYTYVNETIYNALPEELRKVMIDTYVVSGYGSGDAPNKVSTDKLYLLSTGEIWEQGTSNQITDDTARDVTRQLDYYKNLGVTTNNYSGAIKELNGSAHSWWLRSANSGNTSNFYYVCTHGSWTNYTATTTYGAAVAFRIG